MFSSFTGKLAIALFLLIITGGRIWFAQPQVITTPRVFLTISPATLDSPATAEIQVEGCIQGESIYSIVSEIRVSEDDSESFESLDTQQRSLLCGLVLDFPITRTESLFNIAVFNLPDPESGVVAGSYSWTTMIYGAPVLDESKTYPIVAFTLPKAPQDFSRRMSQTSLFYQDLVPEGTFTPEVQLQIQGVVGSKLSNSMIYKRDSKNPIEPVPVCTNCKKAVLDNFEPKAQGFEEAEGFAALAVVSYPEPYIYSVSAVGWPEEVFDSRGDD